ncbi:MAG: hypothetical protein FWG82_05550 [Oscillospiraceae bacterium]|nr:hypothetical protein [Oscillospiraceae bacterium]
MNIEEALRMAKSLQQAGRNKEETQNQVAMQILQGMNPQQQEQFNKLVNDKAALEKLIASPQAKDIIQRFEGV